MCARHKKGQMMKKMVILIAMALLLPLLAGCASDLCWVGNTARATINAK